MHFIDFIEWLASIVEYFIRAVGLYTNSEVVKDLNERFEDKDKDLPRGHQHWVTVKNSLLTDVYHSVSNI